MLLKTGIPLPLKSNCLHFLSWIWLAGKWYIRLQIPGYVMHCIQYSRFISHLNINWQKYFLSYKMARLFLCCMLVASLVYCTLAEEKYTNKFDNFDVDKVLNNDRILTSYIKCLLDQGSCTNEGRELKSKS